MKTTIKNQVTLPPQLFALLEQKAKRFGVSATEYLKFLALRALEEDQPVKVPDSGRGLRKEWEDSLPIMKILSKQAVSIAKAGKEKGINMTAEEACKYVETLKV